MSSPVLSIPYTKFLAARLRVSASRRIELDARDRPFRLFTLDNDAIGRRVRGVGAYEREVLAAIACIAAGVSRCGVALDVGANIGNHAITLSRSFSRVLAFEPNPVMAAALKANALLNGCTNIEVLEQGLSDRSTCGVLRQKQAGNSGTFEFVEGEDEASPPLEGADVAVAVAVMRGDDVLQANLSPSDRIAMIKVDVEGCELAVLRGLVSHLERDRPVVCFEVRSPAEGEPVRRFLEDLGYLNFYAIAASRLSVRSIGRIFSRSTWSKHYCLSRIDRFEQRHYSAVFASVTPLP